MEIEGSIAYLSIPEQRVSGLTSPISVAEIDVAPRIEANNNKLAELRDLQAADDDDLTSSERAAANADFAAALRGEKVLAAMHAKLHPISVEDLLKN